MGATAGHITQKVYERRGVCFQILYLICLPDTPEEGSWVDCMTVHAETGMWGPPG